MTPRPGPPLDAFEQARKVADAVLYEGYVLYPYRASAPKNQLRWQFGVLVPPSFTAEPSAQRTECVIELPVEARPDGSAPALHVVLRFLQLQQRRVEVADPSAPGGWTDAELLRSGGADLIAFEEGVEHQVTAEVPLGRLADGEVVVPVELPGGTEAEEVATDDGRRGRVVRRRWPATGRARIELESLATARPAARLRVVVENTTPGGEPTVPRADALRRSFVATHVMLGLNGARFVSLLDPPVWAEEAVAACSNRHTFPVLVGDPDTHDAVLSSPVIMYDHPQVAPESPGDLYDATEIDELLTLRTLTLTEHEKREARATDPRAAAIVDRVDSMTPGVLDGLHGTFRTEEQLPRTTRAERASAVSGLPPGHRVLLRPGRAADAQDLFLAGRVGVVHDTVVDVDGTVFVTVTLEDDPAAELHEWYGRFLFFTPEELEPVEEPA